MQVQLNNTTTNVPIQILGINAAGQESGNDDITSGRTLPWLQDTKSQDVWDHWRAVWRDVIVLDSDNKVAGIYNLTDHDLVTAANFDSLKTLLVKTANR